ncbi:phosphonate metabolism protein [Labrys okinawensis]|uniref:Phosphonate metabolism protein n=1 Tax=Labrys okinawensis TaxID=346911 RepID=A0A2S9QDE1_9HYPH|nr:DUF1045 domain-containing protein [Labrys okinawensis]PRH87369.1 phosphonate metabolism protein [Labrys okinawensis]
MATRYAIYYVPSADSALWRFGSEVLGYDAFTGQDVPQWHPPGIAAADWHAMTADPRLYGFHATLKAPFRLADDADEGGLIEAFRTFARKYTTHGDHAWTIRPISSSTPEKSFLALILPYDPIEVRVLERIIVQHFDRLRAPLTPAEIARRNPERLSERQRTYLHAHGYPYVREEFRFHMTLSGAIENAAAIGERLDRRARELEVGPRLHIDRLGLFRQDDGGRFRVIDVALLQGVFQKS